MAERLLRIGLNPACAPPAADERARSRPIASPCRVAFASGAGYALVDVAQTCGSLRVSGCLHHKKTERSKGAPFASFCFSLLSRNVQLFAVVLVGNGQLLAAVCAAGSEDSASVLCGHALAESMLVHAATVVRLKCSFHLLIFIVIL